MAQKRLSTLLLILILKQFKLFRLMKKYLISFVAATALILAFTGCSKSNDLYNQGIIDEKNKEDQAKQDQQNELAINEAYATAFEKAFGPVGSNVDWGFSRKSSNARAFTRAEGVTLPAISWQKYPKVLTNCLHGEQDQVLIILKVPTRQFLHGQALARFM